MKYRSLINTELSLTKTEPYDRLKQFCKLGNYRYHIFWDKFSNGVLITCEVFYFINRQKKIIHRETQFVLCDNKNINYPKNIICESFLHNLGLSQNTYNSSTPERESDEFDEVNLQMKSTLTKILGRSAQTLSETLKNEFSNSENSKDDKFINDISEVLDIVSEGVKSRDF